MQNYHDLLSKVKNHGFDEFNKRTGKMCRLLIGEQLTYFITWVFPAITTKKLFIDQTIGELLGFFRGYTNAADFRKLGCTFWDSNANGTQAWLDNPYRKGTDDLGRIYGTQWTRWKDRRIITTQDEFDRLISLGYKYKMHNEATGEWLVEREINQLEEALRKLLTDPSDRRIMVSAYNVAELDMMALRPCHVDYRFNVHTDIDNGEEKILDVVMTQASADIFLGVPHNIASTAIFLSIMARLAGMTPGKIVVQMANAHLYHSHFDQTDLQLSRDHFAPPTLVLSDNIKKVTLDEIPGVFTRINPDDIYLKGYKSHDAIKAEMAK